MYIIKVTVRNQITENKLHSAVSARGIPIPSIHPGTSSRVMSTKTGRSNRSFALIRQSPLPVLHRKSSQHERLCDHVWCETFGDDRELAMPSCLKRLRYPDLASSPSQKISVLG